MSKYGYHALIIGCGNPPMGEKLYDCGDHDLASDDPERTMRFVHLLSRR